MSRPSSILDCVVVIFLCLVGLASIGMVWVAGSLEYGVVSSVWVYVGIEPLIAFGTIPFLMVAAILRRMYGLKSHSRHLLLIVAAVTCIPSALFLVVLAGRLVQGGD